MGDTFTETDVTQLAHAIATWVALQSGTQVAIGYDPRAGNRYDAFIGRMVDPFLERGISVLGSDRPVPTPVLAHMVKHDHLTAGIMLSASHNPPQYNGIKLNPYPGGAASIQVTTHIESLLQSPVPMGAPVSTRGVLSHVNIIDRYIPRLIQWVSHHASSSPPSQVLSSLPPILVDARHGTAGYVWQQWAAATGQSILIDHATPHPTFGGLSPNPTDPDVVAYLSQRVMETGVAFGVAHDPDADRHMIVDQYGRQISPEMVACLMYEAMGGQVDGMVTTVSSSRLIQRMAHACGLTYQETPVGFKWFTPAFEDAEANQTVTIGVESSGGISQSNYLYEKCGFLPAIWMSLLVGGSNRSLGDWVDQTWERFGKSEMVELAMTMTPDSPVLSQIKTGQFDDWNQATVHKRDGVKWEWADRWVIVRPSGTEPVMRIMAEAPTKQAAQDLGLELIHRLQAGSSADYSPPIG